MKTISVFGDSLTYGLGDSLEGGWITRLQNRTKDKFIFWNFGIPGDTSKDLLNRIEEEIKSKNPDIIIIFIGTNDSQCKHGIESDTLVNIDQYKENLDKLSKISKKQTTKIIFVGLTKMDDDNANKPQYIYRFTNKSIMNYDKALKDFCQENNFPFIYLFDLLENTDLSDGAHPNEKGYEKIAEKIEKFLRNDLA